MRSSRSALLVLTCATVLATGCGSDSSLLDGSTAEELQSSLVSVQQAVDSGECTEARSAARAGLKRVDDLPSSVDSGLRDRLQSGFEKLRSRISDDCETPTTTAETPPPTTETTPETTEEPPPVETTPEETVPDETTTDDTTPEDPTTTAPDSGGQGPGSGPGSGDSLDPDGDSGGVAPGVDAPGAVERGVKRFEQRSREFGKRTRDAIRDARERAERAARGQG
jgi:hypothetical protein